MRNRNLVVGWLIIFPLAGLVLPGSINGIILTESIILLAGVFLVLVNSDGIRQTIRSQIFPRRMRWSEYLEECPELSVSNVTLSQGLDQSVSDVPRTWLRMNVKNYSKESRWRFSHRIFVHSAGSGRKRADVKSGLLWRQTLQPGQESLLAEEIPTVSIPGRYYELVVFKCRGRRPTEIPVIISAIVS